MKYSILTLATRALVSGFVLGLAFAGPASADTYIVDRFDDSTIDTCSILFNDCALRGAIIKANQHPGDDIVNLGTGTYTLTIAGVNEDLCQTGDLDVHDTLIIDGEGPERTFIDAAGIDRVLHMLAAGKRLTVRGVTITGGYSASGNGGGLFLSQGGVTLEGCVVTANVTPAGTGAAIFDLAQDTTLGLRIFDSWITGNSSAAASGVYSTSYLLIQRSTISANSGGYSLVINGDNSTVINSTVSGNLSNANAGVQVGGSGVWFVGCTLANNDGLELDPVASSAPTLRNTVILGDCGFGPVSSGGNLESPGNTCDLGGSDLSFVPDAMLSNLGWYGGPTPVHRPLPGSPAVDQAIAAPGCPPVDQRELSRPRDGGGSSAAVCDIGAVEFAGVGEVFVEGFECGYLTPWSATVW